MSEMGRVLYDIEGFDVYVMLRILKPSFYLYDTLFKLLCVFFYVENAFLATPNNVYVYVSYTLVAP